MKRSRSVALGLLPAVASWFAACGSPAPPTHQQLCADRSNQIVDDQLCADEATAPRPAGYAPFYHYYWMPYRAGGYALGALASGGSAVAPGRGSRVGQGRVVTGGFGSTAHAGGVGVAA